MARSTALVLGIGLLGASLGGCATRTIQENAALRAPRPISSSPALAEYIQPADIYPSIGGDTLRGASPTEQADAREAASWPPEEPGKP
jgi:hypothetical protein